MFIVLTSLGLGLVADVGVLVAHTDHDGDVARTTDDGGEDGSGSVVAGESGLDHSGAIVDDQRGGFLVVAHLRRLTKGWIGRRRRGSSKE